MTYSEKYRLKSKDVSLFRRLRTSRLFEMIQEASIAHTEELNMGRDKTLDKGLLWVVTQQMVQIARMPEYDEEIILTTWPGRTMHVLFPRYYQLKTAEGELLGEGSALWALMDIKTRKIVFPEKNGIIIEGEENGNEPALPEVIRLQETDHEDLYRAVFSDCDLNGHMNNTRYLNLLENHLNFARNGKQIRKITVNYSSEVRFDEEIRISWYENEEGCYFSGDGEKNRFRLLLEFVSEP